MNDHRSYVHNLSGVGGNLGFFFFWGGGGGEAGLLFWGGEAFTHKPPKIES